MTVASSDEVIGWFDQLDLDPEAHPVAMRTRALGERPWLLADRHRSVELSLKAELLSQRRDQVLWVTKESLPAANSVAELVGVSRDVRPQVHPLETAALATQEDLCLVRRYRSRWILDASCVCFPTRWHLMDKVNKPIAEVHGPVEGYGQRIESKVVRLFDRLGDSPVLRRNWFLMTDPSMHQPDRPRTELVIPSDRVTRELYIRSERQTLRTVADGWVLFTIRIQQASLGQALNSDERRRAFRNWAEHVPLELGARRHLTRRQRVELVAALDKPANP